MNETWPRIDLLQPAWLAALVVLPVVVFVARRSLTGFSPWRQRASLALRIAVLVTLILALCGVRASFKAWPRALLVESEPLLGRHLVTALESQRIDVTAVAPPELPGPGELGGYELVILSNVPAAALGPGAMERLRGYVRDSGGGLVVIGGDRAFTPGGYRKTVLEEVLPVWCEPEKPQEKPSLAMALVIDCSDSMRGQAIEVAKEATRRAVGMLDSKDQVGVIAFAKTARWVSPIRPCIDKTAVLQAIDTLSTSYFGTDMYPAMEKAHLALRETFARLKHMIVLTDGVSHPADFEALAARIAQSGITISTVGVGREVARPLLEDIARIGNGHFYHCDDASAVPTIFALEAASASKMGVVEKPFFVRATAPPAVLAGLDFRRAPSLLGYVQTRAKPASEVILTSENGEPVLAWWHCGRGVAVAFTSDVQSRWAAAWLRWPDFARFWSQLARHAMRKDETTGGTYAVPPETVFAPTGRTVPRTILLGPYLLALAAVVYVLDLAVRRA